MLTLKTPYLLFLGDAADMLAAKTGLGVAHWRKDVCLGQLRLDGCVADAKLTDMSVADAVAQGAKTMLIGVANRGGVIPDSWRPTIIEALKAGMDVAAGLHTRLNSIDAFVEAAAEAGTSLIDIRVPAPGIPIGNGQPRAGRRVLTVGTDCSIGKKFTALSVAQELTGRKVAATFRATGQTGIMIAGSGVPLDAVVADFISGAIEQLTPATAPDHIDVIEGQGSLFHPSFAGVSMGLLHGSQADGLILCHEPGRVHMRGLPDTPLPGLDQCRVLNETCARLTNPRARVIGISLKTDQLSEADARAAIDQVVRDTGLPVTDPVRFGAGPLADAAAALPIFA